MRIGNGDVQPSSFQRRSTHVKTLLAFFFPHRVALHGWRGRFTKLEYLILNQDFGYGGIGKEIKDRLAKSTSRVSSPPLG